MFSNFDAMNHSLPWTTLRNKYSASLSRLALASPVSRRFPWISCPVCIFPWQTGCLCHWVDFIVSSLVTWLPPYWTLSTLWARLTAYSGLVSQNPALHLTGAQQMIHYAFCSFRHIYTVIARPPGFLTEPCSLLFILFSSDRLIEWG